MFLYINAKSCHGDTPCGKVSLLTQWLIGDISFEVENHTRLHIVTSIERTAYPRFKRQFTTKELSDIYTPTFAEIAFAYSTAKGESNILNLLVILKSFQRLGYFPSIADIPLKIINYIRSYVKFALDIVLGYENNKTMYRHRTAIREYLQVKSFNQTALHLAVSAVNESAQVMDNPADLMNVAIAELIKNRYELPGFNTLNRLVRRVRNVVNQNLFNLVLSRLSNDYQQRLLDLLNNHPVEYRSLYNNLKQLPKRPTRNHLNDLIVHSIWLDVANAVIFHNVVDLTDVLRDLLKSGYLITREDVAALSPYMTSHIKRFGDYLIDMETVPNLLDDDKLLVLA